MKYCRFTEADLKVISDNLEDAVNELLGKGYTLVSVSYVGGCRASGYHVYHFVCNEP